jgi:hypothetical protein
MNRPFNLKRDLGWVGGGSCYVFGKGGGRGGLWYLPWSQIDVIFMGENLASESILLAKNSVFVTIQHTNIILEKKHNMTPPPPPAPV